jgi:hypothetical protein
MQTAKGGVYGTSVFSSGLLQRMGNPAWLPDFHGNTLEFPAEKARGKERAGVIIPLKIKYLQNIP